MTSLSRREIMRLVNDYIGVSGGYLGDFSYRTHAEFYPYHSDLDINPNERQGTTRERFIGILEAATPADQAKIRGVLAKYPAGSQGPNGKIRDQSQHDEIAGWVHRLESTSPVSSPDLGITTEVVERAIADAETLIATRGATSGVDRLHTTVHGYLLAVCVDAAIPHGDDATITELYKAIRRGHPALADLGPRREDIDKILRAFGAVLDALSPVRNRASVAHPNPSLLEKEEAMLVINAARTVLHYLNAKLSAHVGSRPSVS